MTKTLRLLLILPVLAGCGLASEEDGLPPELVLAGEPEIFVTAQNEPYEPGAYVAVSKLVALDGEGLDDIERRVAWGFYTGKAAAPVKFCLEPDNAELGLLGVARSLSTDDCSIEPQRDGAELLTVCPAPGGVSRAIVQRGAGDSSPDLRRVSQEPAGLDRTAELVWHIALERTGDCAGG